MSPETADAEDLVAIMNVFDGADLAVSAAAVERAIEADRVLVARSAAGTVIGALLAVPTESAVRIAAVAVRPGRRGQGVGSALLDEATTRWAPLVAAFDASLAPFYRSNGFAVTIEERGRGRRPPSR
jgi:GNAT superfamily N-acetyltransferase